MDIKGKNILLMMPDFYSLRKEVENELMGCGANVTYVKTYVEKENFRLLKTVLSLVNYIKNPFYKKKFSNNLKKLYDFSKFDYLLVIGIYSGSDKFIYDLKKRNNNIITIYYFWDAFITWNFSRYIDLFDYKYTFDRVDYNRFKNCGLSYLPLFYKKREINKNKQYDITHIGTLSPKYSKRLFVLNEIYKLAVSSHLNVFIRLYAPALNSSFFVERTLKNRLSTYLNFLFSREYRNHILELKRYRNCNILFNDKLSENECYDIEMSSKVILDVNIDNAGCAYRIIKALSMGNKVITTNPYIKYESFYCPENILIIDKDNPIIDMEFINSDSKPIDIEYLELNRWLDKILSTEC